METKLLNELEIKYFKEITQLNAVSGEEKEVANYVIKELEKLNLQIFKDNMGNVIALKESKNNPNKFKLLLDAHMDEVGFMVKKIEENGLISIYPLGGMDYSNFLGTRILLKTFDKKYFEGTFVSNIKGEVNENNLKADFGFSSKNEAINNGVSEGNMVAIKGEIQFLNEGKRILSKAIDDRYGVILILDILNELKDKELPYDLYASFSVQEELGLRGIQGVLTRVNPDIAFALDCSRAEDEFSQGLGKLGEGVLLRIIDRGYIAPHAFIEYQKEAVINTNGKYQYFTTLGTTNAASLAPKNILTIPHCIVGRSIHTPSTVIDTLDFIYAKNSLKYMLGNINYEKYIELKEDKYN